MQALQNRDLLSSETHAMDQLHAFLRQRRAAHKPVEALDVLNRICIGSLSRQSAKRWVKNWPASISMCRRSRWKQNPLRDDFHLCSTSRRPTMHPDSQAIDELVRRIVEAVHPRRIVLFGSAARGEMGPNSDLDVLVIMPDGTHRRKTAQEIYRRMWGFGFAKDIRRDRKRCARVWRESLYDYQECLGGGQGAVPCHRIKLFRGAHRTGWHAPKALLPWTCLHFLYAASMLPAYFTSL
jgi:predicted nucleotidyltransferase